MKSPLVAAIYQMATSDYVQHNAGKIRDAIDGAAAAGADLLVVPECALSGYLPRAELDFDALQQAQDELVAHSADRGIWFALGTTRQREDGWYNSALLFSPRGKLIAAYDKTELTGADERVFQPGQDLPIFKIGDWTVGLQICFDMRFPENWRILRRRGAELILHLSNASASASWKVPVLEGTVRCRAAENGMFVVSANDARVPQMLVSAVCNPEGKHLASAQENQEMMILAKLDRRKVKEDYLNRRRTDLWNREEYRDLLLE